MPYLDELRAPRPPDPDNLPPLLRNHPPRYLQLLRQGSAEAQERAVDPMWLATVETMRRDPADRPLREPLAALLTHTLASGREKISGREIFWRLRVPPHREAAEKRAICRVMRSLGWVRVRYGTQDRRVWGWRWREWNVSHVKIDLNS
jgi:hypothetical protein